MQIGSPQIEREVWIMQSGSLWDMSTRFFKCPHCAWSNHYFINSDIWRRV